MDYWIDGYNLLFKIKSHLSSLEQSRKTLIDELRLHLIKSNLKATIIFDSSDAHAEEFPSNQSLYPLEIVFSPKGLSADDFIVEKLYGTKSAKNVTIVTSDAHLAFRCKDTKAKITSIEDFLKYVFKEESKRTSTQYERLKESGQIPMDSEENIELFARIFEDRLHKNNDS